MEYEMSKMKIILAAILASLMVFATASPAVAQASATAGDATARAGAVTIQYQFCPQIIQQYANAVQNNSGGDGAAAAIAQDLDISQSAVNTCIQAGGDVNIGVTPETTEETTAEETTNTTTANTPQSRTITVNGEQIILSATTPKVLANTGGEVETASTAYRFATLLPAGALLMVSSVTTAFWFGSRRR